MKQVNDAIERSKNVREKARKIVSGWKRLMRKREVEGVYEYERRV